MNVSLYVVQVREVGNLHRHTFQCVLQFNMFYEKLFLILWLWLVILTVLTIANLVYWLVIMLVPNIQRDFLSMMFARSNSAELMLVGSHFHCHFNIDDNY